MRKYYPLHAHLTDGSIGDSVLKVSEYVQRAKDYGVNALAMTDHGSLSAMYHFYDECVKNDIKPIIGMEAYVCEDIAVKDKKRWHLILLAKNQEGLTNLMRIHNSAQVEGFYYRPRTDLNHLQEHGRGIIALSACVQGEIPQCVLQNDFDKAIQIINSYKKCFDEFFLEIQPGNFDEQKKVNDALVKLSIDTNTPLVITNDIHYLDAENFLVHDMHVKLARKMTLDKNDALCYPDMCYWFMSYDDLKRITPRSDYVTDEIIDIAVDNTNYIAAQCNVKLSTEIHMPKFSDDDEDKLLNDLCQRKLAEIIQDKNSPQIYVDRLERELAVIKEKGFSGYFLIVHDYINYARQNGIAVGAGRGSAAGSLVSYLLKISQADPIKYGLLFERFLDPNRAAIPDIDVDLAPDKRDAMFNYLIQRYGQNCCALVSTFHIRKARGSLKDAARLYGVPPETANEISKLIPYVYYGDDGSKMVDLPIKSALAISNDLKVQAKIYPKVFELASKLEGLPSAVGIHAAGMLVSPIPLTDVIPLTRTTKDGILATSLDLQDAENCFVKYDLLSLATASLIAATENDVGWKFNYRDDSLLNDDSVWKVIGSKNTVGIFQIASSTYKTRMPRLKPKSIRELAACLALIRSPSIIAKTDQLYMEIVEGRRQIELVHPIYDEITAETNGVLLYQEQIMHLAVAFGFDLSTGYKIVKLSAEIVAPLSRKL